MRLKVSLLSIGMCVVVTTAALGQAHFGLRMAPTIGYMSGSYIDDGGGGEWGLEMGLTADVLLFANVEFVTGLNVMHQAGGRKIKTVDSETLWGYKFSYIQIPMRLRPMFKLGDGPWHLAPFTGVYVGLNGTCKIKDSIYHGFSTTCHEGSVGGAGIGTDIGIPVGLDVIAEFPGGSRWEFSARMDVGLTNVLQGAEDQGLTAVHRLIVLGFGFSYPLY
jgi:hypothetical protein